MKTQSSLLIVLVVLAALQCSLGFVLPPSSQRAGFSLENAASSKRSVALQKSGGSTKAKEEAEELLSLLIERHSRGGRSGRDEKERVDLLVDSLIASKADFDPNQVLNGPLWAVCYRKGPTPLWEDLGLPDKSHNLQGQEYKYNAQGEKSVVNYAEIFGKAFHIRAYGTYDSEEAEPEAAADSPSMGAFFSNWIEPKNPSSSSSTLLTCPVDFTVKVNKGSVNFLGKSFEIPVAGTGYLRVLFANPSLRIFISPKDTTDSRWEKEGLVVVQVRSDLLLGSALELN